MECTACSGAGVTPYAHGCNRCHGIGSIKQIPVGDMATAAQHMRAATPLRGRRWTCQHVTAGGVRLRLDYQADKHVTVLHVRHDPRDMSVNRVRRATYYGHVRVAEALFEPTGAVSHYRMTESLTTFLREFARNPQPRPARTHRDP